MAEARHLIEKKNRKPAAIYPDQGFESSLISHILSKKSSARRPPGGYNTWQFYTNPTFFVLWAKLATV